jgi:hypothetical protein
MAIVFRQMAWWKRNYQAYFGVALDIIDSSFTKYKTNKQFRGDDYKWQGGYSCYGLVIGFILLP